MTISGIIIKNPSGLGENAWQMSVQCLSAHSHHHQHILTDALPQTVGEAILKGLFLGFVSGLLLQLGLEADPSCAQL